VSRVLIIVEGRTWSERIVNVIRAEREVTVVAVAREGFNLLKEVRNASPDIVLADRPSIMVALLEAFPRIKVIGVQVSRSQPDILECVKAGIAGFILEDATLQELLKTIRLVAQGRKVLPAALTDSLFSQVVEHARGGAESVFGSVRLTPREREISLMIPEGLRTKEIAQRLCLSTYTVKSHVHNILQKLGLHSRMDIILKCRIEEPRLLPSEGRGRVTLPIAPWRPKDSPPKDQSSSGRHARGLREFDREKYA